MTSTLHKPTEKVIQSARAVLMVHPAQFTYNPDTHDSNHYQSEADKPIDQIHQAALYEFDALKNALENHGVEVHVFRNEDPLAPDAIFPNAASAHPEGVALYPMLQPNRQRERSPEFVNFLTHDLGYPVAYDFSHYESEGRALEATASLVMDRINKIAYCALSSRTDAALAQEAAAKLGYKLITFETKNHTGNPIYHTDVLMFIGSGYTGICLDCIVKGREEVEETLRQTHEIVELSTDQLMAMCGNALEVMGKNNAPYLVMSDKALAALREDQKDAIAKYTQGIIHADLSVVEKYGGGSARCMLMDLH